MQQVFTPTFECDNINKILKYTPWAGHRVFAYDLVKNTRPNIVVELGAHYGCSFFSFAQAVKDFSLNTELVAVDTWEGDSQAGFYGEEVFEYVKKTVDECYSNLDIKLFRTFFNNAVDSFKDNSIDILHIDGFHDYYNVREDFETWLPKVRYNGIILFHDIAKRTTYGSSQFWEEIKEQYSYYLEFSNDWGLGVLFLSQQRYNEFLTNNDLKKYEETSYYYGDLYKMKILEQNHKIVSQSNHISNQDRHIAELKKQVNQINQSISESKESIIRRLNILNIKDVILYGTGSFSKDLYYLLKENNITVNLFVDSNQELWGRKLFNIDIVSIKEAVKKSNFFVVGSFNYKYEIEKIIFEAYSDNGKKEQLYIFSA